MGRFLTKAAPRFELQNTFCLVYTAAQTKAVRELVSPLPARPAVVEASDEGRGDPPQPQQGPPFQRWAAGSCDTGAALTGQQRRCSRGTGGAVGRVPAAGEAPAPHQHPCPAQGFACCGVPHSLGAEALVCSVLLCRGGAGDITSLGDAFGFLVAWTAHLAPVTLKHFCL